MANCRSLRRLSPPSSDPANSSSSPPDTAAPSTSLPADLIPAIAARLTTLEDFFAFRAACRSYRAVLPPCRCTLASQPPLLLLATSTSRMPPSHLCYSESLHHLPLRCRLSFRLPWGCPPSRRTLLYAHGFLVTAPSRNERKLLLLHLFSREQLRLPKTPAYFTRLILSGDLLTILFTPGNPTVRYCRPGDALWRAASIDPTQVLMDLLFVNGTLYALLGEGCRLAVVELLENSVELSFLGGESDELNRQPGVTFMLGECGGEVFLIREEEIASRWLEDEDTVVYRAFRWEFGEGKWVTVTSLGGRTMFLNRNGFAACIGPDCPGFRGDCIYSAWLCSGDWCEYSLIDGTCDVCYAEYPSTLHRYAPSWWAPVWVFPSLC